MPLAKHNSSDTPGFVYQDQLSSSIDTVLEGEKKNLKDLEEQDVAVCQSQLGIAWEMSRIVFSKVALPLLPCQPCPSPLL